MNKLTIIIITSFLIFNFSCKLNKKKNSNDTNYKIFNYPEGKKQKGRWTEVDSLYKKGLPKSALKVIQEIYTQALKENNVNQVIKATIHKLNYNQRLKEPVVH